MATGRIARLRRLIRLTEALHLQSARAVADLGLTRDSLAQSLADTKDALEVGIGGAFPSLLARRAARLGIDLDAADERVEAGRDAAARTLTSANGLKRRMGVERARLKRQECAADLEDAIDRATRSRPVSLP